ncbi:MAG: TrkA family potassium uptake protein [Oscillospiraceae bacterium]|nr:TrkA family potassium uptake protein [Oscillospiraceae bacterium]
MKRKVKSYIIFGISKFGRSVAEELTAAGMHVLAVDIDEDKVQLVADTVTMAVVGDVTDMLEMERLGLSDFDGAVVATTGNLAASVMGVILSKEAKIPYVLAKAGDEMQATVLEKLGADRVVIPEQESAHRIANILVMGSYVDMVELSDRVRLVELTIRPDWRGKSLRTLDLRGRHSLNVVAVRALGELTINWDPDAPLPEDCSLLVVAERRDFEKLGL